MCGFVAMLSLNGNKVDQSVLERMTEAPWLTLSRGVVHSWIIELSL